MATAAKLRLDLGSAKRTCHQNEFFNCLLAYHEIRHFHFELQD